MIATLIFFTYLVRVLNDILTIRARGCAARSYSQGVVLFISSLNLLKTKKTAVFALTRLRNTAVFFFFRELFKPLLLSLYDKNTSRTTFVLTLFFSFLSTILEAALFSRSS